jgi:hypothetical protein
MSSAICTLYEGHYHHGVAALTNSLYKNGFRGSVYVGYRGELPPWAKAAKENPYLNWKEGKSLSVVDGLVLHFLPIITNFHLANYKPDFMLELWKKTAKQEEAMFYFDPDIVIKCQWDYFENWIDHGVAMVHEIIANDMPETHPLRKDWAKVISKSNRKMNRVVSSYINSGFCGLLKKDIGFLHDWSDIIKVAAVNFGFDVKQFALSQNRGYMFFAQDQDAFNIAAMCSESPISEMGPEAMDFIHGGFTMSHATGSPKPWKKNFIISGIKGNPPSLADKAFWNNVGLPIKTFSGRTIKQRHLSIKVASFLGRFYRKY